MTGPDSSDLCRALFRGLSVAQGRCQADDEQAQKQEGLGQMKSEADLALDSVEDQVADSTIDLALISFHDDVGTDGKRWDNVELRGKYSLKVWNGLIDSPAYASVRVFSRYNILLHGNASCTVLPLRWIDAFGNLLPGREFGSLFGSLFGINRCTSAVHPVS